MSNSVDAVLNMLEEGLYSPRVDFPKIESVMITISRNSQDRQYLTDLIEYGQETLADHAKNKDGKISEKTLRRARAIIRAGFLYGVFTGTSLLSPSQTQPVYPPINLLDEKRYVTSPSREQDSGDPAVNEFCKAFGINDNTLAGIKNFAPVVDLTAPGIAAFMDCNYGRIFSDEGNDGLGETNLRDIPAERKPFFSPRVGRTTAYELAESLNLERPDNVFSEDFLGKVHFALTKEQNVNIPQKEKRLLNSCNRVFKTITSQEWQKEKYDSPRTFLYSALIASAACMTSGIKKPEIGGRFLHTLSNMVNIASGYFKKDKSGHAPAFVDEVAIKGSPYRGKGLYEKIKESVAGKKGDEKESAYMYSDFTKVVSSMCVSVQEAMEKTVGMETSYSRGALRDGLYSAYLGKEGGELRTEFENLPPRERNIIRQIITKMKSKLDEGRFGVSDPNKIPKEVWLSLGIGVDREEPNYKKRILTMIHKIQENRLNINEPEKRQADADRQFETELENAEWIEAEAELEP